MKRTIDLSEISDGKLYLGNDLAKTDCGGCLGCSSCCSGMEETIVLDPYDIFNLCIANRELGYAPSFESLLGSGRIELKITDNLILPLLSMKAEGETCTYLGDDGRCRIHAYRPGICRLFPMARIFDDGADSFRYFLQIHECPQPKFKIRISKWIGIPNFGAYEKFISSWHHITAESRRRVTNDPSAIKDVSMTLLNRFYLTPYDLERDFYEQFRERAENLN